MDITRVCDAPGWLNFFMKKPKRELLFILYERERYMPEYVAMVEEVLKSKYGLSETELHSASLFTSPTPKAKKTRDILIELLTELGVHWYYEYDEDWNEITDGDLYLDYLGGSFRIQAKNNCNNIRILLKLDSMLMRELEEVAQWRKAINEINRECNGTIVFTINEWTAVNDLEVHLQQWCWLRPRIPNLMFYLHDMFRSMLDSKHAFLNILENLKQGDSPAPLKRLGRQKDLRVCGDSIENIFAPKTVFTMDSKKRKGTRELFISTLTQLGCPYMVDDDDEIGFLYQGVKFWASVSNASPSVVVYCYAWESVDLSDLDKASHVRQAINEVNWMAGVATMYTIDSKANKMYVDSKGVFLFIPSLRRLPEYLGRELYEFFRARQLFIAEMAQLGGMEKLH